MNKAVTHVGVADSLRATLIALPTEEGKYRSAMQSGLDAYEVALSAVKVAERKVVSLVGDAYVKEGEPAEAELKRAAAELKRAEGDAMKYIQEGQAMIAEGLAKVDEGVEKMGAKEGDGDGEEDEGDAEAERGTKKTTEKMNTIERSKSSAQPKVRVGTSLGMDELARNCSMVAMLEKCAGYKLRSDEPPEVLGMVEKARNEMSAFKGLLGYTMGGKWTSDQLPFSQGELSRSRFSSKIAGGAYMQRATPTLANTDDHLGIEVADIQGIQFPTGSIMELKGLQYRDARGLQVVQTGNTTDLTPQSAEYEDPGDSVTDSDYSYGSGQLAPRRVHLKIELPRDLLLAGGAHDVAENIKRELMKAALLRLTVIALTATETTNGKRVGLLNTTGITTEALGTNGGNITIAKLDALQNAVLSRPSNGKRSDCVWWAPSDVWNTIKTLYVSAQSGGIGMAAGLLPDATGKVVFQGSQYYESNVIPQNLSKGSGRNLAGMLYMDPTTFYLARFSDFEVMINPFSQMNSAEIEIHVMGFWDHFQSRANRVAAFKDAIV